MISLGIDFGGTSIKFGVTNGGEIIAYGPPIETQELNGANAITQAIVDNILALRQTHPAIAAIGLGLPGIVDSINGIVHELSNVPGWHEVPLRQIIADACGLPTIIENDANAMAYGEWKYGAAQGKMNVICITLGTGVGGGLILNGQLYRGANLGAGEIGHMHYDPKGPAAIYGNTGAIEKIVGNREIIERMNAIFGDEVPEATPAVLTELAHAGDARATALWNEIGTEIGIVLSDIVWLLNPDAIVIGGGVAKAGELVFGSIRRAITGRTLGVFHQTLTLVPASLGNDAGIIGSAAAAVDSLR
ncbi:MAG TPA: ROK family protein [Chthoniobacterales bacterium]|jgi:glucokinase